ncbi:MAG: HisA/HisF-related TIM barrel protein [Gemmatimonadetes bacterium]|nr:HisA/HisF-related TIM barrel protein [Gemmatimonadota bacterium]
MNLRIIPRLDIKGPNLVTGVHFERLRVLGRSGAFACHYYEQCTDELIYKDEVASLYQRSRLLPIVEWTAREIFILLTVADCGRSTASARYTGRAPTSARSTDSVHAGRQGRHRRVSGRDAGAGGRGRHHTAHTRRRSLTDAVRQARVLIQKTP